MKWVLRCIFFLGVSLSSISNSAEIKVAMEGELIAAIISKSQPTRISVMDDRIKNVVHKAGSFSLSENTDNGDIFIIPNERLMLQTIHLFLLTEKGYTYQMALTPQVSDAKTILVRPSHLSTQKAVSWEQETPVRQTVVRLMKAMIDGEITQGITRVEKIESIPFKDGLELKLKSIFTGASLTGNVYQIKNETKEAVKLKEIRFYEDGVLAVHLEQSMLIPGAVANVYVVRKQAS